LHEDLADLFDRIHDLEQLNSAERLPRG